MKEKFSRIPESLFRDDRFTAQEKIIVGFRLGQSYTGYWTYKVGTVAELFGVKRNVVMKSYRKMKQYGFLDETEDKQTVMKSIMEESGSLDKCIQMNTPMYPNEYTDVSKQIQGCIQMNTPMYPNEYIDVSKQIHQCIQMNTPTPPVFIGKTENVKNIKEDIKNIKEDIMNTKEQQTDDTGMDDVFKEMEINYNKSSIIKNNNIQFIKSEHSLDGNLDIIFSVDSKIRHRTQRHDKLKSHYIYIKSKGWYIGAHTKDYNKAAKNSLSIK